MLLSLVSPYALSVLTSCLNLVCINKSMLPLKMKPRMVGMASISISLHQLKYAATENETQDGGHGYSL